MQQQQLQKSENNHPKQVQHKEAYIKYIANMRKQQQLANQANSLYLTGSTVIMPDWYRSLDVRSAKIKESKVMPPPSAWIEKCHTNDVIQNLITLRYYMLNDAINVDKTNENYSINTADEMYYFESDNDTEKLE